jgi:hypothetical protein
MPVGANRPLINGGSYSWAHTGQYHNFNHLRFTTTGTSSAFATHAYSTVINCKASQKSTVSANSAFAAASTNVIWILCEGDSLLGYAFSPYDSKMIACYAHDSKQGVDGPYGEVIGCVIDTCQTGIDCGSARVEIFGNTIRNCVLGIEAGTIDSSVFINNIIADCVTGASLVTSLPTQLWDYNCWSNNGTDVTNVTKGSHDVTADALLVSGTAKGTDGVTSASGLVFTAATNPFGSVTTSDCLNIVETGTGATLGVYVISSVDGAGQITLATSAGASKSNIDYCIVLGSDFTLSSGSPCFNAGLKLGSDVGL